MRVACLQFNPHLGNLAHNLKRAEAIISKANPKDLDLLILPEMAFTGYNFKSLQEIQSHLEPTATGPSTVWARGIARQLGCHVVVGYPEYSSQSPSAPQDSISRYNSAVLVSPQGNVLANYRKSFLFTTDESWCEEGPGKMAMGICMDLNPKNFTEPFEKYEFGNHIVNSKSDLVVVPMAWLSTQSPESIIERAKVPDGPTLSYWMQRLQPVIDHGGSGPSGETIFVACNRIGSEGDTVYAGTSAVVGITKDNIKIYGCLGCGTEDLLVCDVPGGGGKVAGGDMDPGR
ncbi:carbon-nitrogen hydrolase [Trichophaea hybrida]|nr:carbon-nitrogen hydrolase [Trichophaea hybrida]